MATLRVWAGLSWAPWSAAYALIIVLEETTVATFWRVLPWAWIGGLIVALVMVSLRP